MNKKITIRPEEHKDYKSIISLILRSFQEGTDYSEMYRLCRLTRKFNQL